MKKKLWAAVTVLFGAAAGAVSIFNVMNAKLKKEQALDRKNDAILKLYNQWFELKKEGKSVADYCKENGYRTIAIYGMHYLGESLCRELEDTDITVKYAIDRNADRGIECDIDIYAPDEILEEVDAVIVSAFTFYDEIEEQLGQKLDCPIISLEDVLYEL